MIPVEAFPEKVKGSIIASIHLAILHEPFRIQKIRIHQTGEQHAYVNGLGKGIPLDPPVRQKVRQRDLPVEIGAGEHLLFHAPHQRRAFRIPLRAAVGQSAAVARHRKGAGKILLCEQGLGSGRGVIRTDSRSADILLKFFTVLSLIVDQTDAVCLFAGIKYFRKVRRPPGCPLQVLA